MGPSGFDSQSGLPGRMGPVGFYGAPGAIGINTARVKHLITIIE